MEERERSSPPAAAMFERPGPKSGGLVLEWSRRGRERRIALSPPALWGLAALAALLAVVAPCAAFYLAFRDDMLAGLLARQAQMQYAYEDRLAALRLRLDQATSRQFIDQDGVEGKVQTLVVRQAQLETRAAMIARLVEGVATTDMLAQKGADMRRPPVAAATPALTLPPHVRAYVSPDAEVPAAFAPAKPEPEGLDLRLRHDEEDGAAGKKREPAPVRSSAWPRSGAPRQSLADAADPSAPLPQRLRLLASSLDRVEREQTARVASLVEPAREAARRLRRAFDAAGLPVEHYLAKFRRPGEAATGGPYVPVEQAAGDVSFDRQFSAARIAVATLEGLRLALPTVPLRRPLPGDAETTSTFGYRTDPFLGRPALHTGIDLRDDYGAAVRATASGVVVAAGPNGGYGSMVEIDHGDGLATRYAHLSAISAGVGQEVAAGEAIGRVGSTGRSTGPHLHYEVRVDGEPVDPARFLRAAATLD